MPPLPDRPAMRHLLAASFFALTLLILAACSKSDSTRFDPLPPDAVVLVIGDSLVAGTGARRDEAWPQRLEDATGWRIVNAGVPGNTSADARRRLPELLDMHAPQAVIIAVGGNDFLRGMAPDDTRANIAAMVRRARSATQHVALVAIPARSLGGALIGNLSDHELYGNLATEHELALVADAVSDVLSDADLRADRIHANAAGYARIAEDVRASLQSHGWLP